MDMPHEPYVPELPADLAAVTGPSLLLLAIGIEDRSAAFYGAAVEKAGPVLAEIRREFTRFQKENVKNKAALQALLD